MNQYDLPKHLQDRWTRLMDILDNEQPYYAGEILDLPRMYDDEDHFFFHPQDLNVMTDVMTSFPYKSDLDLLKLIITTVYTNHGKEVDQELLETHFAWSQRETKERGQLILFDDYTKYYRPHLPEIKDGKIDAEDLLRLSRGATIACELPDKQVVLVKINDQMNLFPQILTSLLLAHLSDGDERPAETCHECIQALMANWYQENRPYQEQEEQADDK